MRILVVDDMEVRHRSFRKMFIGCDLVEARTAKEAIDALGGPAFDLVQLDHDLSEEHYLIASEGLSEERRENMPEYKPGTGMDVVDFLVQQVRNNAPNLPGKVVVHSWNPYRAKMMYQALREAGINVDLVPFRHVG